MRRKILFFIFLIFILALAATYFYRRNHQPPLNEIILFGNVDVRQVDLGFRVSGRVDQIFFEEGDLVPPGTLMGVLDKQPYLDQKLQAEAGLASTKASLENSQLILKRRRELITDGSISQEDLDNAISNTAVLEANLKNAEASLAVASTNLAFTEVYAPTEGIILSRIREPGTVVNPGQPIYTLSITSPIWVRAFIPEPLLGVVYPGMPAEIYTDTKGGKVYQGQVGFISPIAEFTPKTVETTQLRTNLVYRLRIYVENTDRALRQGMPVTVRLKITPKQEKP